MNFENKLSCQNLSLECNFFSNDGKKILNVGTRDLSIGISIIFSLVFFIFSILDTIQYNSRLEYPNLLLKMFSTTVILNETMNKTTMTI